jgi:ElaB/YqjD/DUF883 family membrane-anchored ribosome-binding protein
MSELLHCPFCGGRAIIYGHEGEVSFGRCVNEGCGAEGPPDDDPYEAVAAWNRRLLPAAEQAIPAAICDCGDHCQDEGSRCASCVSSLESRIYQFEGEATVREGRIVQSAAEQAVDGVRDPIEAAHERVAAELKHERGVLIGWAEQAVVEAAMEWVKAPWTGIAGAREGLLLACAALAKRRQGEQA